MTYNWYDTRASTWYEGYGPGGGPSSGNAGNFVDINTLSGAEKDAALNSLTNNVIAMLERQGVATKDVSSTPEYKAAMSQIHAGNTKEALQGVAGSTTSAWHRNDLWGADETEGGDSSRGLSFLTDGVTDSTTIQDLYTQGFGDTVDEIDAEGLKYWEDRLAGTSADGIQMSIQEIAASFAASDEAQLRTAYHEQYGRDEDTNEHIDYWLNSNDESATGISDVQNFLNAVTYRGEDQDGDGIVSAEERLTSKYMMQGETMVRDDLRDDMGLVSREVDRANTPFFTAPNTTDVQNYVDHINATRTDSMIDQTTGERTAGVGVKDDDFDNALFTNTHIGYQHLTQDALSQGDVDDFGDDATGMGRFGTKAEIKEYMDDHMGGDSGDLAAAQASDTFGRTRTDSTEYGSKVFSDVMDKTWGALTDEKVKTLNDYVPSDIFKPDGHELTRKDASNLLMEQNWDHWKGQMSSKPETPQGTTPLPWTTVPEKPDLPTPLPIDRKDINYMPNVSSDVQDTSGYGQAKKQFDQAVTAAAPDVRTAQGQAGQRFTGTSAKGVRMKRSKASRMGTIRGTKQLGREQQTKSLNI